MVHNQNGGCFIHFPAFLYLSLNRQLPGFPYFAASCGFLRSIPERAKSMPRGKNTLLPIPPPPKPPLCIELIAESMHRLSLCPGLGGLHPREEGGGIPLLYGSRPIDFRLLIGLQAEKLSSPEIPGISNDRWRLGRGKSSLNSAGRVHDAVPSSIGHPAEAEFEAIFIRVCEDKGGPSTRKSAIISGKIVTGNSASPPTPVVPATSSTSSSMIPATTGSIPG